MTATRRSSVAHSSAAFTLTAGVALLLGLSTVTPAWAHDSLIDSSPEAEEVLKDSPEEVVLEFSGDGLTTGADAPNTIWVIDADGEQWEGETEVDDSTMRTELSEPLPDGEYEVLYNAVYSDTHSEELSFNFEVDSSEVEGEPTQTQSAEHNDEGTSAQQTEPAEQDAAEDAAATSAQDDGSQIPVWIVVSIGVAVLALIAAAMLLVRRKLNQADHH